MDNRMSLGREQMLQVSECLLSLVCRHIIVQKTIIRNVNAQLVKLTLPNLMIERISLDLGPLKQYMTTVSLCIADTRLGYLKIRFDGL